MARLAKFWNKTLILELETNDSYVNGRSSIMEIVAFEASRHEEEEEKKHHYYSKSYLGAFKRFLEMMAEIKRLQIRHETYWNQHGIRFDQMKQPSVPYVVDPSFPENNFLTDMTPRIMELFSRFANETLCRINQWENGGHLRVEIFENQPRWHDSIAKPTKQFIPGRWLLETIQTKSNHTDIKYKEGQKVSNKDHQKCVEIFKKYLVPVVLKSTAAAPKATQNTALSNKDKISSYVFKEIQNTISRDIIGGKDLAWVPGRALENRVASVTIPLHDAEGNAIQISFDLEQ